MSHDVPAVKLVATGETVSKEVQAVLCKLRESGCELFIIESPANRCRPEPPDGFVPFRSHKRRIFVAGRWPRNAADLEALNTKITLGAFIESPLVDATRPATVPSSTIDYL